MINKERGEVPILLDGKTYPMRPSYAAIHAIEQTHGPIVALATRLSHPLQRLSMGEMAAIVTEAIRAAGKDRDDKLLMGFQKDKIAELIYEAGVLSVIDPLELLLINMITGGGKPKGGRKGKKTECGESQTGSTTGD